MRNVVLLLGGESSGKTTLAKALEDKGWHAVYEYGREYGELSGGEYTFNSMLDIALGQLSAEKNAIESILDKNIVIDTNTLVTEFYSKKWFDNLWPKIKTTAQTFDRYTDIFLLKRTFPLVQDGTRQDESFSDEQFEFYRDTLDDLRIPYTIIAGEYDDSVARRVSLVEFLTSKPF